MRIVSSLLFCVMLVPALVAFAAADDSVTTDTVRIAVNGDAETIEVRPLDDPDNPYLGQYDPWDIWVWDNYNPGFDRSDYQYGIIDGKMQLTGPDGEGMPEGWNYHSLSVDADGYVLPDSVRDQLQFEHRMSNEAGITLRDCVSREYLGKRNVDFHAFYASGFMPADMKEARQEAYEQRRAMRYPVIPAWLGEHLPLEVVFSPNGDILCYGELGLHYRDTGSTLPTNSHMFRTETWYRYSPEGELLGTWTKPDDAVFTALNTSNWVHLYWPDMDSELHNAIMELGNKMNGCRTSRYWHHGYLALKVLPQDDSVGNPWYMSTAFEDADIAMAFDMYGNEVNPDAPLESINTFAGISHSRDRIEPYYHIQVENGVTDPAAASPFTGEENGPQIVDPTPRFPRFEAHSDLGYGNVVEVRPPDDPANPYRDDYEAWDLWIMDQIGRRNPREDEFLNEQFQEIQKHNQEKLAAGEEVTQMDQFVPSYKQPDDDPWVKYTIHIDDDGWILPVQRHAELQAEINNTPWDVRETLSPSKASQYSLEAGGVMPGEMCLGYAAAIQVPLSTSGPVVPAWLAAAPAHGVVFVPNGDVLTLGPAGEWTPEIGHDGFKKAYWEDKERAWYRYDATGNLVDSYVTNSNDWQVLYCPGWNQLKSNAVDNGMEFTQSAGYLVITDPATGTCKAVFDYNGMPVDPNSVVSREYQFCRVLYWSKVKNLPREAGAEIVAASGGTNPQAVNLHELAIQTETFTIEGK